MRSLVTDLAAHGTTHPQVAQGPACTRHFLSKKQALQHWRRVRDDYQRVAADLESKLKSGMESENADTQLVSLLAAKMLDHVSQGRGHIEFRGMSQLFLSGIILHDDAMEDIYDTLALRVTSVDDSKLLQYVNTARSVLREFFNDKSIVCIGWMVGNIRLLDFTRKVVYDEQRIAYNLDLQRVFAVTAAPGVEDAWPIPENQLHPRK